MKPDKLLLDLHTLGITLSFAGDTIRAKGPTGGMTPALTDALRECKPLLLAITRTLNDRSRDADWDVVRDWLLDDATKTFTKPMLAAAGRVLPVATDEWPEAYARRFRSALRVRGLLMAFSEPPIRISAPAAPFPMDDTPRHDAA